MFIRLIIYCCNLNVVKNKMEVRKFIIIDNELIMALVEFHNQLIPKSKTDIKPTGGGRWV